ncbi:hypothetical protein V8C26DRAFT_156522 [Trichoderma gracile]
MPSEQHQVRRPGEGDKRKEKRHESHSQKETRRRRRRGARPGRALAAGFLGWLSFIIKPFNDKPSLKLDTLRITALRSFILSNPSRWLAGCIATSIAKKKISLAQTKNPCSLSLPNLPPPCQQVASLALFPPPLSQQNRALSLTLSLPPPARKPAVGHRGTPPQLSGQVSQQGRVCFRCSLSPFVAGKGRGGGPPSSRQSWPNGWASPAFRFAGSAALRLRCLVSVWSGGIGIEQIDALSLSSLVVPFGREERNSDRSQIVPSGRGANRRREEPVRPFRLDYQHHPPFGEWTRDKRHLGLALVRQQPTYLLR